MKELKEIVRAAAVAKERALRCALATVVNVDGSSYRRPGARMLVTEEGNITGAISGGCLEGDALQKALFAIAQHQNRLVVYDTSEEDNTLGVQLGCNGIVSILFEPLSFDQPGNQLQLLSDAVAQRKASVIATGFNMDRKAPQAGTTELENFRRFDDEIASVLKEKRTNIINESEGSVLFQYVEPEIRLVICGAGNDAQPLAAMAAMLGWQVIVTDGRPGHATTARFPAAEQVIVSKAENVLGHVTIDERTAVVLMTHNYNYDLAMLEGLLATDCKYTGVLGPKKKLQKLLNDLHARGIKIRDEQLENVYGPAGLDIGAEGADEIALSIIAEIKAAFAGRGGSSLRFRTGNIYDRKQA